MQHFVGADVTPVLTPLLSDLVNMELSDPQIKLDTTFLKFNSQIPRISSFIVANMAVLNMWHQVFSYVLMLTVLWCYSDSFFWFTTCLEM